MNAITDLGGKTKEFVVTNLADRTGTPITTGATVTINLYDASGSIVVTGSVVQDSAPNNANYYADITLPTVTALTRYVIKAKAVKNGLTWEDEGDVWVTPF